MTPLVTVICLCYNHARFLKAAIDSVVKQTYSAIEIIIVDDSSTDESVLLIEAIVANYPSIQFVKNETNIGMCRSFNKAFKRAKGDFIIDFACDDKMASNRVEEQILAFSKLNDRYGVVFSDANIIDEKEALLGTFYKRDSLGKLVVKVPTGDVFKDVVHSYQICSPTIMIRKKVLDELDGYNELLSYEDYDFFIRSSRNYFYYFIDKPLTYHRKVKGSDSSSWYKTKENVHLTSTLIVCEHALTLCKDKEERHALLHSIRYHFRQSVFLECFQLSKKYYDLLKKVSPVSILDLTFMKLSAYKIRVNFLYRNYKIVVKWFN